MKEGAQPIALQASKPPVIWTMVENPLVDETTYQRGITDLNPQQQPLYRSIVCMYVHTLHYPRGSPQRDLLCQWMDTHHLAYVWLRGWYNYEEIKEITGVC